MKEKEKCTMKAEDSSYGPVADSRCPFSEYAPAGRNPERMEYIRATSRTEKTETPSPHLVVRRRSSNARFIHIALVALAENG